MASSSTINERAPFRFLNFPSEVRNRIYHHALGNAIIRTDQPSAIHGLPPKPESWPFLGLLLTSKQIHQEASYILYRSGRLHLYAGLSNLSDANTELSVHIDSRFERHLERIENLQVEVGWLLQKGAQECLSVAIDRLGRLRTVTIKWLFRDRRLAPHDRTRRNHPPLGNELLRVLLLPFVRLQAKAPRLRIEVETGLRGYWREGGLRTSWDVTMGLEEYVTEELDDPETRHKQNGGNLPGQWLDLVKYEMMEYR